MTAEKDKFLDRLGLWLAEKLRTPTSGYQPYTHANVDVLAERLHPGDILLVEGNQYVSAVIKYLTQSTWSHAAMYVGPIKGVKEPSGEPHTLIEVNLGEGCISCPLSKYETYNTRICRPVGLTMRERRKVADFMIARLGLKYDTRNILDMIRYFFPIPVPRRFRRRMIALGSGDPTRAICSSLIAQAFQAINYPILPKVEKGALSRARRKEIYVIRHHSLFAPRDFDLSPYFEIVKPAIDNGFNHRRIKWKADDETEVEPEVAIEA